MNNYVPSALLVCEVIQEAKKQKKKESKIKVLKDNDKYHINTKSDNNINSFLPTLSKPTNQEVFDLKTYKKFLSFLKFQEMMDEYST